MPSRPALAHHRTLASAWDARQTVRVAAHPAPGRGAGARCAVDDRAASARGRSAAVPSSLSVLRRALPLFLLTLLGPATCRPAAAYAVSIADPTAATPVVESGPYLSGRDRDPTQS